MNELLYLFGNDHKFLLNLDEKNDVSLINAAIECVKREAAVPDYSNHSIYLNGQKRNILISLYSFMLNICQCNGHKELVSNYLLFI